MEQRDILVVGGGMAGLSAALYGGWLGRSVTVVEREMLGGQIVNADQIENFPGFPDGILGADLVAQTRLQIMKFGAQSTYDEVEAIEPTSGGYRVRTAEAEYQTKAVIVASGGARRSLGVKGEEEFEGRGVSHCATCDGAFFVDVPVAVVGGGDTALDEALFLTQLVSKVTIIHRREELRASVTLLARARANPKIEFVFNAVVDEIGGHDHVEGLTIRDMSTQSSSHLPVSGIFVCVGFEPATGFLAGLMDLDPMGHIPVDVNMQTPVPGILAVGDARQYSVGQLAAAAGDGVTAAVSAHRYISSR